MKPWCALQGWKKTPICRNRETEAQHGDVTCLCGWDKSWPATVFHIYWRILELVVMVLVE